MILRITIYLLLGMLWIRVPKLPVWLFFVVCLTIAFASRWIGGEYPFNRFASMKFWIDSTGLLMYYRAKGVNRTFFGVSWRPFRIWRPGPGTR